MKKLGDRIGSDGLPYCFRKVVDCPDEPIASFWIAKLECGHTAQVVDRSHLGAGKPLGVRCEECEAE
jgi:hypothetical protein